MIEYRARSADAWEALCIEQFQLCRVDWAASSFGAGLRATAGTPQLSLRQLTSGPFGVSRTPVDVRRHESDALMLVLHDGGVRARFEHRGMRSELSPGDAVLVDTRRPYAWDFPTPIQQTVLKIPHAGASRLDAEVGRIIRPAMGPLGRVLRTILRELVDLDGAPLDGGPGIEATSMATAAVDILAGIYAADPSLNSGLLGHEALLKSAQDFVRSRFMDPRLSPALIAEHLRVSPRLVAKIFSDARLTPAAFIRMVRMDEAARLLRSPAHRNVAVFDIGLRVGFPDATTFTRAFKRAHGMVPSEFRSAHLAT